MSEDETTRKLLDTTDAMVWAEEFCAQFGGRMITPIEQDGTMVGPGTMVGWFANAIEVGRMNPDSHTLWRVLIGDRTELYHFNAEFHAIVDAIVKIVPDLMAFIAERCAGSDAERYIKLAEAYIGATNPGIDMDEVRRLRKDQS